MKSAAQKLEQLAGLLLPVDLTDWEQEFIGNKIAKVEARGGNTTHLSGKVVDIIDRVHGVDTGATGRGAGCSWAKPCPACSGAGHLSADADNGKTYKMDCPECDGTGDDEPDLETDYNGLVVEG